MNYLRPLLIALQFMTLLPIRLREAPQAEELGRSVIYYPVIGLLIGLLLAVLAHVLFGLPELLVAALLLVFWVAATGALHLDGLADSADAWIGGLGDKEKTLTIMKDPRCGPMAVVVLLLVLLLKFVVLHTLLVAGEWGAFVVAPVLARAALPVLFLTTPYVRPGGLGSALAEHLPRRNGAFVVAITVVCIGLTMDWVGLWMLLATATMLLLLRLLMVRRLGGMTGDTAGATVELIELAVLVVAAIFV
jgi:adenosylcobinamide-GDP ribazoletransferase